MIICFVLDVCSFPPSLLTDLQESLRQLSNLLALRKPNRSSSVASINSIGLCSICIAPVTRLYEVQVVLAAKSPFNLRDFHHAVSSLNALANNCHSHPRSRTSGMKQFQGQVSCLTQLTRGKNGISSWGSPGASKKLVVISSHFAEDALTFHDVILEAVEQCLMIEFIQIEPAENHDRQEGDSSSFGVVQSTSSSKFHGSVTKYENCTFRIVEWNPWSLLRLVKHWLQDVVTESEGPLEIVLCFQESPKEDTRRVFCSVHAAVLKLADVFIPCKTCRCHGMVLDLQKKSSQETRRAFCPFSGQDLDVHDVASNCVSIGHETILYYPSFKNPPKPPVIYESGGPPAIFKVVKCLPLDFLDEGLLFGMPYYVLSSSEVDMDAVDEDAQKVAENDQFFKVLCQCLCAQDSGLLCTSTTDVETGIESSFCCFYLLLPAENGSLMLKRIAGTEDFLPFPQAAQLANKANVPEHIRLSVYSLIKKLQADNYDPLNHERGCSTKLDSVLKETLHFWPTPIQNLPISASDVRELQEAKRPNQSNYAPQTPIAPPSEDDLVAGCIAEQYSAAKLNKTNQCITGIERTTAELSKELPNVTQKINNLPDAAGKASKSFMNSNIICGMTSATAKPSLLMRKHDLPQISRHTEGPRSLASQQTSGKINEPRLKASFQRIKRS
ncbi:hypothetical protein O6H91_15G086500 [Diphasiastrum complanatum]|uniref:Uncharacterized protein n=1 Tax=Diphasiastrum complanatum TaxID=34168 RepID=A0ACC2BKK0_DIPCM|nr:hypothetical protein O6H91_15G086500 [Diphasiastrum complanatum]